MGRTIFYLPAFGRQIRTTHGANSPKEPLAATPVLSPKTTSKIKKITIKEPRQNQTGRGLEKRGEKTEQKQAGQAIGVVLLDC